MNLKTLSITFDLPLFPRELPQFRGAIAEAAGWEHDLFHNHDNNPDLFNLKTVSLESSNLHYRYPLIQYRIKDRKAALFALQEGVDPLRRFLLGAPDTLYMGGKLVPLRMIHLEEKEHPLRMLPHPNTYKLFKWLPLNGDNYEKWLQCHSLSERIALLERVLASHIISFAKGVGWRLPERLEVHLQHIQQVQQVSCHGNPMLAFNIIYTANIQLPPYLALGKAVSHGFGWQVPVKVPTLQTRAPRRRRSELLLT